MAGNDIYLRSVPSDANAADVRLYVPTTPDSATRLAGIGPVVARLPTRPRLLATFGLVVGLGPSQAPAPTATRTPVKPVVVAVRQQRQRVAPIVGTNGSDADILRIAELPKVVAVCGRIGRVQPIIGRAPMAVVVVATRTPIAPTVVRLPQRPGARVLPIVGVGHFGGTTASVPDEAQRGGSSRRWKDQWRRTRPLPLKTITVTVEVPDVVVEQPVERTTSAAPPPYKKLAIPLTVPAVPVAEPSLQPVADALLAMRTTYDAAPVVDWHAIEAQLMLAFHEEQARIRAEWTRKAILAVLLIEES